MGLPSRPTERHGCSSQAFGGPVRSRVLHPRGERTLSPGRVLKTAAHQDGAVWQERRGEVSTRGVERSGGGPGGVGLSNVCCQGPGCVDRQADNNNCGTCGGKCGTGLTCLIGTCLAQTCTAATQNSGCVGDGGVGRCCASSCADLKVDAINCGSCERLCAIGESCANSVCGVDTCTPSSLGGACHFDAGTFIIGGTCCGAGCVDTRFDRTNCGGCNRLCPGDAGCVSGVCR